MVSLTIVKILIKKFGGMNKILFLYGSIYFR